MSKRGLHLSRKQQSVTVLSLKFMNSNPYEQRSHCKTVKTVDIIHSSSNSSAAAKDDLEEEVDDQDQLMVMGDEESFVLQGLRL